VDLLEPAMAAGKVVSSLIERRTFWSAKEYFFHTVPRVAYAVKSDYLDEPLDAGGIEALVAAVDEWPGSSNEDGAGAAMFLSGGAINRIAADATAFVHRSQYAVLATESTWTPKDTEATVTANVEWLDSLAERLRPHVSGSAYQNFIDRGQPDWERAYYGANFDRLVEVKRRYDPDGLFDYEQGIPAG
jgi:FAD/FMN-containing dehydrogenase